MADMNVFIGVDVGGTNTDAIALYNRRIVAKCKYPTTLDVTVGIQNALSTVLSQLSANFQGRNVLVCRVNIGTTHFLNAVLQRKGLVPVAVIRLCGSASRALPPFCDFPDDLKTILCAGYHFLDGGYEFDGEEITSVRKEEVRRVISQLKREGTKHVVVSGVFSSLSATQEILVGQMLGSDYPEASFTLSHQVANMGLLERENSSILNESLKALSRTSIAAFVKAVRGTGLTCPVFFTQNDGTIISAEKSSEFPVLTFSSGPTNSMRGAAFLCDNKDAIVIDIGGTTTDVGVLEHGFPREASTRVKCGGVTTNFRMPDVLSIALGGGSIVRKNDDGKKLTVGPDSVGYELVTESLVYGGQTQTTTDIAVAGGICKIGDLSKVDSLETSLVDKALSLIREMIENSIDQVKVRAENQPVILVGGGSVLIDAQKSLVGASIVLKPEHFEVANAVGAALSQVSGTVDHIVNMADTNREKALQDAERLARARAIKNGALADTVVVVEKTDVKLSYLKGNATRIVVKVVGDLILTDQSEQTLQNPTSDLTKDRRTEIPISTPAMFSDADTLANRHVCAEEAKPDSTYVKMSRPFVEKSTGDWLVSEFDVDCIATGAGILGCGGGGSPYLGRIGALCALKSGKEIRVIHPNNVPKKGLVLGVGFMGAPSVFLEKLLSGQECRSALENVQKVLVCDPEEIELEESKHGVKYVVEPLKMKSNKIPDEKRIVATMSLEIGGANSITPLILGAERGLPVVDCDGMGRAFPELQMFVPSIHGLPLCPCAIVGSSGSSEVVTDARTAKDLENHFRDVVVTKMGCSAGIAMAPLTAQQLSQTCVKFSMSRAWHLGYAVKMAQKEKRCPVKAVLDMQNGKLLMSGKVIDVERKTEGGFNRGHVKVAGFAGFSGSSLLVSFQNENLLVEEEVAGGTRQLLASTPDLISLVDSEFGEPIPTEDVRYGLRVSVIVLPCSPLLKQDKALDIVGPQAFGYSEHAYKPAGVYRQCDAIPSPKFSV